MAGDDDAPALTLSSDPLLHTGDELRALYAARCAEYIVGLLNDDSAGFKTTGGPLRALQPADIAVLVRTGTEATAVRLALRQRRVASVYLSDRDSVFAGHRSHRLAVVVARRGRSAERPVGPSRAGHAHDRFFRCLNCNAWPSTNRPSTST